MAEPTIDLLLNLVPDRPDTVLAQLRAHPSLAGRRDAHGYSLLHAAASYEQAPLAQALVREFGVDPNLLDEDGETALFSVESADMARLLLALGTDRDRRNDEGQTAVEKFVSEDEWPEVIEFLGGEGKGEGVNGGDENRGEVAEEGEAEGQGDDGARRAPPLPDGVRINVGTMSDAEVGDAPDPEFRRRIEELAARGDFDGEDGQRELRRLVEEAVSGIAEPEDGQGPATRRRLG